MIRPITDRLRYRGGDYLFVSGPGGDGRRYRCDHQAEQLRLAGASVDVAYHAEVDVARLAGRYRTTVLYRVPWDEKVQNLLARGRGATVLADVDDLVFDRDHAHEIRALATMSQHARDAFLAAVDGLRRTLEEVDGVTVSTDPLRAHALRVNPRIEVVYNAVDRAMVERAQRAAAAPRTADQRVVVAYLSGTPTHDADFAEAADALLALLAANQAVEFWAVGYLTRDDRFDRFEERVRRIPPVAFRELPRVLARVDVNLAPLERDNAFTDAKSCLKYLEAALVAVATVASPRADFARVIRDGENGLLAEGNAEWSEALERLVRSPPSRMGVGERARAAVLAEHTTAARAASAADAFGFEKKL